MSDRDDKGHFLPAHTMPGPGRDTKYNPEMNQQVRKLALLGCTEQEIADVFDIGITTFERWKHEYPAFWGALNEGRIAADAEVAHSLYQRAMGEITFREISRKNGDEYEVVRLQSKMPADPGAAKLWLTNRQPEKWRDRTDAPPVAQPISRIELVVVHPSDKAKVIEGTINGYGGV